MRNWFKGLSEKTKKTLFLSLVIIGIIFCAAGIKNYYLIIPGIICLIPGCIFADWYNKDKKEKGDETQNSSNENYKQNTEVRQSDNMLSNVQSQQNVKPIEKPQPIHKDLSYTPPEGYELVDWTYTTTLVRGCSNYIDEDYEIDIDSDVEIIHEPIEKYPENTAIYIDDEKVGSLKQDMAIEWYQKFGKNYRFTGTVVEYEPGEYPRLLIEIKKPIIRKMKKTKNN